MLAAFDIHALNIELMRLISHVLNGAIASQTVNTQISRLVSQRQFRHPNAIHETIGVSFRGFYIYSFLKVHTESMIE